MAFDGVLKFATAIDQSGFESAINKLGSLAKKGMEVVTAATAAATGAVAVLGEQAISAYADYEQLTGGVETLFKSSANTVMEYAENAYKTAGLSANEYMETVTGFSAALISSLDGDTVKAAEMADMAIIDMADNANKMGSSIENIQNAYQGFAKQNYTMLDNLKLGYGGTKSEMERLLADAEAISGIHYDISNYSDVISAIHEIQTSMGITGTTAEEASYTISGSIGAMKSAWDNLVTGLATPDADIGALAASFTDTAVAAFDNLIPAAEQALEGIGSFIDEMVPKIAGALPEITNYLPDLADIGASIVISLADGLIDNAGSITESAMSIIGTLVTTFGELMPKLAELAVKAISEFAKGLSTNISQIKSTAKQMIQSFADMLKNNLPELIQSAVSIIVSLAEVLADNADIILDAILSTIEVLARSLIENIDPLIDAAVQIIISLADYISNNADEMTRVTIEIIEAVARCLIENAPKLLAAALILLGSLVAAVPQILEELLNELGEVGADVLLWLDDVCEDALLAVGSWLSDISDSAVQGAKDAVSGFIEFFDELPDDIAYTLKNALDKVGSWATDMNNKASETGRDFLNGVADFFTRLPRQIKEKLDDTLNKVATWGIDLASVGKNAAGDLFDAIVDKIKSLPSELRRIGQELVEGLWKGIDEAADWLDDKMSGFADGVVDGVKGFFGIASPSKVMRDQVGIYLAQGIEEGFVREIPETGKAALEALQGLEVLKPEVKLPAIKIDLDDPDRNDSPSFAPGALRIMSAQTTDISSISQPSPTSDIVNNYSYSTVNNTTATEAVGSPVNIQLVIGEEIIAEGVVDIASDKLDKAQGQKVVLRKRGLA